MHRTPLSFENITPYPPLMAMKIVNAMSQPGDTVAKVTADYAEVFACTPSIPDTRAPLLRAMATELYLGGIDSRLGLRVTSVTETPKGIRVFPRFDDGLLGRVVEGFEALSCHLPGAPYDA